MRIFLLLIFLVSCSSDETKSADVRLEDKHNLQSDFGPDLSDNKAPLAFDLSVNTFFERSIACTLEGRDPDGDSLEFEILSQPENGTLSGDLPELTYKPKLGFLGKDGFTFRISDGSLFSDAAEVKISVTAPNEKPVLTILKPELDSVLGSAIPVELKASAIDAEDGDISASIKWESSLDGVLGEGENIEVMLSVGEHFIRAEVVDSGDKVVSTTVNLDIIATYPTQIIGTSGDDDAGGIAIDSNANLYVAGSTDGSIGGINLGGRDGFLIKHDSEGKRLWAKSIASSGEDTISGIVAGQGNNIFVIGSTTGSIDSHIIRGGQDAFIIKFDPDGNIIWSKQFGSSDDDLARGLHIDTNGEIYVVGETRGSLDSGIVIPNQESDGFIIKFDTLGNEIWTRQILNVGKQSYESVGIGKTRAGSADMVIPDDFLEELETRPRKSAL